MTSPLSSSQLAAAFERSRRDVGLRLDGAQIRRDLHLKGVTAGQAAQLSGVSANALTRALAGAPISTLRSTVGVLTCLPMQRCRRACASEPPAQSEILVIA